MFPVHTCVVRRYYCTMKNAEPQHFYQDDRGGIDTGVHPNHSNRQGLHFTQEAANPALADASQTYIATGANVLDEFVNLFRGQATQQGTPHLQTLANHNPNYGTTQHHYQQGMTKCGEDILNELNKSHQGKEKKDPPPTCFGAILSKMDGSGNADFRVTLK